MPQENATLAEQLLTERDGVLFSEYLAACAREQELIRNYDRLRGTNLSQKGSGIDLAIDQASGRMEAEVEQFIEFCWDLFQRY